ncbi:MAG: hypothetical protein PHO48_00570 [Candidatus Gracilibacteria bacterium]|nr:hypothetical protein [Candidatus Gracilibacteria bacterium]MDD5178759.1 hypothetical protein [Candidatus Gracilibacteria bacterium]
MGRYYYDKKVTVEDCKGISVFFLKKHGYFSNFYRSGTLRWLRNSEETGNIGISIDADNQYLRVEYISTDRETGEKREKDYKIRVTSTSCHFGGYRYWFSCYFCNKRVGKLFIYGKNDFACRHCLDLSYKIRNAGGFERMVGKIANADELDEMRENLRIKYYRGKPTKRFQNYLKKSDEFKKAIVLAERSLSELW